MLEFQNRIPNLNLSFQYVTGMTSYFALQMYPKRKILPQPTSHFNELRTEVIDTAFLNHRISKKLSSTHSISMFFREAILQTCQRDHLHIAASPGGWGVSEMMMGLWWQGRELSISDIFVNLLYIILIIKFIVSYIFI